MDKGRRSIQWFGNQFKEVGDVSAPPATVAVRIVISAVDGVVFGEDTLEMLYVLSAIL